MQIHGLKKKNLLNASVFKDKRAYVVATVVCLSAMTLSGCNESNVGTNSNAGQAIARVNGDEVTIHQVNSELQAASINAEEQGQASKHIVKALIERQVMVQAALEARLDRNPRVLQAVESAKAKILAQAYLEEKLVTVEAPQKAQIADYYNQHPERFADRKVYTFHELILASDAFNDELEAVTDDAKSMDDIRLWLDEHGIKYRHQPVLRSTEAMQPALLNELAKIKVGDFMVIRAKGSVLVWFIKDLTTLPVEEEDATTVIAAILSGEKRKEMAMAEMSRLEKAAKIIFLNKEYELVNSSEENGDLNKQAVRPDDSVKGQATDIEKTDNEYIEKGLSGL